MVPAPVSHRVSQRGGLPGVTCATHWLVLGLSWTSVISEHMGQNKCQHCAWYFGSLEALFIHSFIGWVLIALASLELTMLATQASNSPTSDLKVMGSWAHTTMPRSILDCVCMLMYVCLYICVFIYMCVHVHVCVIACGITGRSLASSSIILHVSFFESGSLLNPDFADLAEVAG